jgi:CDP-glycerol glycerophosphotransferase
MFSNVALLSVVVPARNVALYIEKCTSSVLRTTDIDLELIVVDDASTDATDAFLRALEQRDERVRVLHNAAPVGPGPARNVGLATASGDFVWFVDADDWLFDGALAAVARRLDENVDVVFVNYVRVFDDGRVVPSASAHVLSAAPRGRFTLGGWPEIMNALHVPWNKVVRRSLLTEKSLTFRAGLYEDVEFTYATLRAATAIEVEQFVCYGYRSGRPGALTETPGEQHLVWSEVWRDVLRSYANEPPVVRRAIFERMVAHGWAVLANPHRLHGPLRKQFFERFVVLAGEERPAGAGHDVALTARSWTLARLRLLSRQIRTRVRA